MVEKVLVIGNYKTKVSFAKRLIRITNNDGFKKMLSDNLIENTKELVYIIKKNYQEAYGKELRISNHSMEVEIWGHVYGEYFIHDINKRLHWKITERLDRFVQKRCEVIDCGERKIDNNRLFWNVLGIGKKPLGWLLGRRLRK